MRKFIFILIASIIFVSCTVVPTKVNIISEGEVKSSATFEDFFNPVELIYSDNTSIAIIMDKNTGVLYVQKETGSYKYGISPIYDSDGSILTYEKWLARKLK